MNCKHVQELLPLYVGRDLEDKHAKLVMAHLQSCAECAGSANEYRETRQLLQQFAPPPFSEGVYAGIRQRVLREIGRESPEVTVPTMPQFVASLFRPRIRWAIATALVLAVSVFAFYFIANRRNNQPQLAGSGRPVDRTRPDEQANARSPVNELAVAPAPSSDGNNGPHSTITGRSTGTYTTIAGAHQAQRRKSPAVAAGRTAPPTVNVAVNTPDTGPMTAAVSLQSNNLAAPDAFPTRNPATSEKTLRVEMQTKDRNIRIIWFSQQRTKQHSPGKSSKVIQEVRSYA